jgi:hypothetical protein
MVQQEALEALVEAEVRLVSRYMLEVLKDTTLERVK